MRFIIALIYVLAVAAPALACPPGLVPCGPNGAFCCAPR